MPNEPKQPEKPVREQPVPETKCIVNQSAVNFCHRCGFPHAQQFCPRCGHRQCLACGDG